MKAEGLLAALDADLGATWAKCVGGGYYVPLGARYLSTMLDESIETEDERDRYSGSFRYSPADVNEYLEEHGWLTRLASFSWLGMGPVSWNGRFSLIGPRDRAWLAWWDDFSQYRAVAALRGADDPEVVSAAVRHAVLGGAVEFGTLPDSSDISDPGLLSYESLESTYRQYLDQGSEGRQEDWRAFVDRCFARGLEPNHLRLSSQVLEAAVDRFTRRAYGMTLSTKDRGKAPSSAVRNACFKAFWEG